MVAVARAGGGTMQSFTSSAPILQALNPDDEVMGPGYGSIQQNVMGTKYKFQNVLQMTPSQLVYRVEVNALDNSVSKLCDMAYSWMNVGSLASTLVDFYFGPGNLGQFSASIKIRGFPKLNELTFPEVGLSDVQDELVSGYLVFCGYAGGSEATFGPAFSSDVVHQTDPSVTDLQAYGYPNVAPPTFVTTDETSDTAQNVVGTGPNQVTVRIAYGTWP
jgi:hypothetical protein